jgi:hypothetical protein
MFGLIWINAEERCAWHDNIGAMTLMNRKAIQDARKRFA